MIPSHDPLDEERIHANRDGCGDISKGLWYVQEVTFRE